MSLCHLSLSSWTVPQIEHLWVVVLSLSTFALVHKAVHQMKRGPCILFCLVDIYNCWKNGRKFCCFWQERCERTRLVCCFQRLFQLLCLGTSGNRLFALALTNSGFQRDRGVIILCARGDTLLADLVQSSMSKFRLLQFGASECSPPAKCLLSIILPCRRQCHWSMLLWTPRF